MFAAKLRKLRLERGLSIKEVADKAGFPISTYRSWEEGTQIVGEAPYIALSKFYNISLDNLIIGVRPEFNASLSSDINLRSKLSSIKITLNEIEEIITAQY